MLIIQPGDLEYGFTNIIIQTQPQYGPNQSWTELDENPLFSSG